MNNSFKKIKFNNLKIYKKSIKLHKSKILIFRAYEDIKL